MKTYKIKIFNFIYTIDSPVLLLFIGVFVDIVSTSLFVGLNAGTEANPILKELISISVYFIPIYLLATNAIFVPFLSSVLRKTFSYTFGTVGLLLGLNNLSLVFFNYAFLVDALGFSSVVMLFVLFSSILFVYFVRKEKLDKKLVKSTCFNLLLFLMFIVLIHFIFLIITWINSL
jgi:hypothetical protein